MNGHKSGRNSFLNQAKEEHRTENAGSPHAVECISSTEEKLEYTLLEPSCSKQNEQANAVVVEEDGPGGIVIRLPAGSNINDFQFIPNSDGSGFPYHIVQVDSNATNHPTEQANSVMYEMPTQESGSSIICHDEDDLQDSEMGYHQESPQHFTSTNEHKSHDQIERIENDQEPLYVNAKQYDRIMKRREARAKLERDGRIPRERQKYLHKSRHEHALRRIRGEGGKFDAKDPATPSTSKKGDREERSPQPVETYVRREVPIMARPGGPRPNGQMHPQHTTSIPMMHPGHNNGLRHHGPPNGEQQYNTIGLGHVNMTSQSTFVSTPEQKVHAVRMVGSQQAAGYTSVRPPISTTVRPVNGQRMNAINPGIPSVSKLPVHPTNR